jgi:hypothetical protein
MSAASLSERPTKRARVSNVGEEPNPVSVEPPGRDLQTVDLAEDEDEDMDALSEQPGELRASDLYLDTVRHSDSLQFPVWNFIPNLSPAALISG